jgi:hypothetical protein
MNRVIKAYVDDVRNDMPNFWRLEDGKVVTDKSVIIYDNLVVEGDVASSAPGENNPVGIQGIKLNGQTYTDYDGDGVIDLGEIESGLDTTELLSWLDTNKYIKESNLDTYGVATKSWVEGKSYLTSSALNGYATQQWVNEQGFAKASALSDYLPLSGGILYNNVSDTPLYVKSDKGAAYIGFKNSSDAFLGYYGFNGTTPIVYSGTSSAYYVIHSGNIESYALPIGGGTITGNLTLNQYLRINAWSGYGSGTCNMWYNGNNTTLEISGNVKVMGTLTQGSDIRFKHRINDIALDLDVMANAPLFNFYWNDRADNQIHIGTSAQYWETYRNELVSGTDFKGLDYSTLGVAMGISLAKKVKELEAKIKYMEERYGEVCE